MRQVGVALACLLAVAGCSTRSISDSGYSRGVYGRDNALYKGELSEFAVLGIDANAEPTDEEIVKTLADKEAKVSLKKGDRVLLIQSGALFPDHPMVEGFSKFYSVVPFTGIPEQDQASNRSYTKSLRLAAAKAGAGTIVAYWGVLEAAQENAVTKTVSWVPIVGWMVPDESQNMRIRLKVFVIDVATGRWEIVIPRTYNDEKYSSSVLRAESDQKQVTKLKELAYQATVDEIVKLYSQ